MIGKKYGKLTILEEVRDDRNFIHYICRCDCGTIKKVYRSNLISGKVVSCGCYRNELSKERMKKINQYILNSDDTVIGIATNTGREFLVDYEDYLKIKNISWHESNTGYIVHKDTKKSVIQLHRLITQCPPDKVVDHINHNKLDNRKSNLRVCTQRQNSLNTKPKSNTGEFGISFSKGYYYVQVAGKYRGIAKQLCDAIKIRDAALIGTEQEKFNYYL